MRSILIDWLAVVHLKFKLLEETLFLTVNLIDRYLEKKEINRNKLQLVGVAALFIASKYEEIYPPDLKKFAYVTDNAYTTQNILEMEGKILLALEFNITFTSSFRFIERYFQVLEIDSYLKQFCLFLLENCLIDFKISKYSPSMQASAVILIANKINTNNYVWTQNMTEIFKCDENSLLPCAKEIFENLKNSENSNFQAIRSKYFSTKFFKILMEKCQLSQF